MAIAVCIKQPEPPKKLKFQLPLMGAIEQANDSLVVIDDLADRIAKFQKTLAPLMAPVQQFIEIVQAINAIRMCIQAIPDAVITLSPKPIIDCIQNLGKAIAVLISLMPPLAYIPTGADLVENTVNLIDAILDVFKNLDIKVGKLKSAAEKATNLGDTDLDATIKCAQGEVGIVMANTLDSMAMAQPVLVALMDQLAKLMTGTPLQPKLVEAKVQFQNLDNARKDLIDSVSIPAITPIVTILVQLRNILVVIYNIIAPLIGRQTLNTIITPTFENLS